MKKVRSRKEELTVVKKTVLSLVMGVSVFFLPVAMIGAFYLILLLFTTQNFLMFVFLLLCLITLVLLGIRYTFRLLNETLF